LFPGIFYLLQLKQLSLLSSSSLWYDWCLSIYMQEKCHCTLMFPTASNCLVEVDKF
jgi:hypothetical protein